MKTIGERLRDRRKELGLTQREIAQHVGVSATAVTQWEADQQIPNSKNLLLLSEILRQSPSDLISEKKKSRSGAVEETAQAYNVSNLRPDQIRLLEAYDKVDESLRKAIFRFLEAQE